MYKVVNAFFDLEDNNRPYKVGETYPRKGFSPDKKRLQALASEKNRLGMPLIKEEKKKK